MDFNIRKMTNHPPSPGKIKNNYDDNNDYCNINNYLVNYYNYYNINNNNYYY